MEKRDNISELEEKDSELDPVVGEGMEENEETIDTPIGECTSKEVVEDLSDENEDFLEELTLDTDEASEKDSDTDEDEPEEDEPEEDDKKTAAEILAAVSRVGIIPSNEEENKRDVESSEDSFVSAGEDGEVVTTDEPEEETPADDTPDREISAADIDAELDADEASEAEELSDEEEIVEDEEFPDDEDVHEDEEELDEEPEQSEGGRIKHTRGLDFAPHRGRERAPVDAVIPKAERIPTEQSIEDVPTIIPLDLGERSAPEGRVDSSVFEKKAALDYADYYSKRDKKFSKDSKNKKNKKVEYSTPEGEIPAYDIPVEPMLQAEPSQKAPKPQPVPTPPTTPTKEKKPEPTPTPTLGPSPSLTRKESDAAIAADMDLALAREVMYDKDRAAGNEALRYSKFKKDDKKKSLKTPESELEEHLDKKASKKAKNTDMPTEPVAAAPTALLEFTEQVKKRELKLAAKDGSRNDIDALALRYEYKNAEYKHDLEEAALSFVKRANRSNEHNDVRAASGAKLLKRKSREAAKYEKRDNERYYGMLLAVSGLKKLPRRANKQKVNALLAELYELLIRRDEVNRRLVALYSGAEGKRTVGVVKRDLVNLKARRKEYKKQEKLYQSIMDARIELRARDSFLAEIDKQVARAGEIAESKYALSHGKIPPKERKEIKRFLKTQTAEYKRARVELVHKAQKLIKKARKRHSANTAAMVGWIVLLMLLAIAGVIVWQWDAIASLIAEYVPALGGLLGK